MRRRSGIVLFIGGMIAIAGVLFVWSRYVEPIRSHSRWYGRVRQDIHSLAHKRPPEVNKGQWEFVVGWTINLHGNCGSIRSAVEPGWRDRFSRNLSDGWAARSSSGCGTSTPATPPTAVSTGLFVSTSSSVTSFDLEETSIADLQARMTSGEWTSKSVVEKYLGASNESTKMA